VGSFEKVPDVLSTDLIAAFPEKKTPCEGFSHTESSDRNFCIFFRAMHHTHRSCNFLPKNNNNNNISDEVDASTDCSDDIVDETNNSSELLAVVPGGKNGKNGKKLDDKKHDPSDPLLLSKRVSMEARFLIFDPGCLEKLCIWARDLVELIESLEKTTEEK